MSPKELLAKWNGNRDKPCHEQAGRIIAVLGEYDLANLKQMRDMAQQFPASPELVDVGVVLSKLVGIFEEPAAAPKSELTLTLTQVVRVEPRVRSHWDNRVWVVRSIAEYRGSDGEIYRKSFEHKSPAMPVVPASGTHESLAVLKCQWRSVRDH